VQLVASRETTQLPATVRIRDAARLLGYCETVAYRAARLGELPTVKPLSTRGLRVPTAWLLAQLMCTPEQLAGWLYAEAA
jgi:hypothetical protein